MRKKDKIREIYGNIMKIYGCGYGMVLGRVIGIINVVLLGSTYMIAKGYEPGFIESILFGLGIVVAIMISGYIFLKTGLQKAEMKSNFLEQPQQKEMYERIQVMSDQVQSINEYLAKKAADEIQKDLKG